jgi:hypothetical protein
LGELFSARTEVVNSSAGESSVKKKVLTSILVPIPQSQQIQYVRASCRTGADRNGNWLIVVIRSVSAQGPDFANPLPGWSPLCDGFVTII